MKVEYTEEVIFSFDGPNLCFLGNESDFKLLASSIIDLTDPFRNNKIDLYDLAFLKLRRQDKEIIFSSKSGSNRLATLEDDKVVFELDSRYWERLFKYFVLMSWSKSTYYLNSYEDCLSDLTLEQDCNFICSSGYDYLS